MNTWQRWIGVLIVASSAGAWAPGAVAKAGPATAPAKVAGSTTVPATQPAASAQELGKLLKQMKDEKEQQAKVAHIDLSRGLQEKPAGFALFGDVGGQTHYSVLKRLKEAAEDKELAGVLITLGGNEFKLAQAQELRDAIAEVTAKGKATVVYADRYSTSSYMLASGAKDICILPGGEIMMPGVAVETMFARGLLDKVGIKPNLIQIGEYKGASESLERTEASPELRGELNRLVDSLYTRIVSDIAQRRGIGERAVRACIDRAMLPAAEALDAKLVDHVVDIDGLRELMAKKVGKKIDLLADYGIEREGEVDFSNPFAILQLLSRRPAETEEPCVALVYVDGMIVEGSGGDDLFADSAAGDGMIRKAMRAAQRDSDVKAVVIRIDSPGGSALASEAAWQAIRRVAKEKPVIVSVGGMAASGGYYIASAGDRIYADASSIVGSIGVVGGKMSLGGLYQKLGISSETFSRGANAAMFSSSTPFTESQQKMIGNLMRQTYDQFVDRILQTRKGKIQDIDKVARGRIFTAESAVALGLVDELGGLRKALDDAAAKGKLPKDYVVKVLPTPRTLADLVSGGAGETATPLRAIQSPVMPAELQLMPAPLKELAILQIMAMREMERGSVMLIPPVMMHVR